jgi:hypothetical protein
VSTGDYRFRVTAQGGGVPGKKSIAVAPGYTNAITWKVHNRDIVTLIQLSNALTDDLPLTWSSPELIWQTSEPEVGDFYPETYLGVFTDILVLKVFADTTQSVDIWMQYITT